LDADFEALDLANEGTEPVMEAPIGEVDPDVPVSTATPAA